MKPNLFAKCKEVTDGALVNLGNDSGHPLFAEIDEKATPKWMFRLFMAITSKRVS
jgi:hypothetical protein